MTEKKKNAFYQLPVGYDKPIHLTLLGLTIFGLIMSTSASMGQNAADYMGLIFMAMAGYNPESAVALWQKMSDGNSASTPEFMSTHPSDAARIAEIKRRLPEIQKYQIKKKQE